MLRKNTSSSSAVLSTKFSPEVTAKSAKDLYLTHPELRITALGGGHGLYATLSAIKKITSMITAIVTVADDGGSSGRIRGELGLIPPGDLRMALAALLPPHTTASSYENLLQHRFGGTGALAGHPVGNLLLAGLTEMLGDPVAALTLLGRHFGIIGRVLPMSTIPLEIEADVVGLETDSRMSRSIRGQVAVATTLGKVRRVHLIPEDAPVCSQAIRAIDKSDLVILGPGSWFSSVIPHLLIPEQLHALIRTKARKVLILNLVPELGETGGFTAERHIHVFAAHAPRLTIDDIIVDETSIGSEPEMRYLERAAELLKAKLHIVQVANLEGNKHDPALLASALGRIISGKSPAHSLLKKKS